MDAVAYPGGGIILDTPLDGQLNVRLSKRRFLLYTQYYLCRYKMAGFMGDLYIIISP